MTTLAVKSNSKTTSLLTGTESSITEHFLDNGVQQGTYYCEKFGRVVMLEVHLSEKLEKNKNTTLFTLPEDYRPVRSLVAQSVAHSGATIFGESTISIGTDGVVSIDSDVAEFLDHSFNLTYIVSGGVISKLLSYIKRKVVSE